MIRKNDKISIFLFLIVSTLVFSIINIIDKKSKRISKEKNIAEEYIGIIRKIEEVKHSRGKLKITLSNGDTYKGYKLNQFEEIISVGDSIYKCGGCSTLYFFDYDSIIGSFNYAGESNIGWN